MPRCVVIGAGPAGLAAAHELSRLGRDAVVLEASPRIGGISQTAVHRGYRFDIGGHRFFTKVPAVQRFWEELLGDEFLLRPRLSRIYYEGAFFDYPLRPVNALLGLGPWEAIRVGLSYLHAQLLRSGRPERSFEDWVTRRFGRRLFEIFFQSYTEKVWGIPCSEIDAEWAAQRIRDLDLSVVLRNMVRRAGGGSDGAAPTSLIEQFHYPRFGPGQMWEACVERLRKDGVGVELDQRVVRIHHDGTRVRSVVARTPEGDQLEQEADAVLASMPLRELVHALDPAPPEPVLRAADRLRYRDFLTVVLIVDQAEVFPDNWIYVHSNQVRVGRIQNFKNWSPDMVPDPERTSLGMEYFLQEGDELWCAADEALVDLARRECGSLGLIDPARVVDGVVVRMPKAYPVVDGAFRESVGCIREHLARFENLLPIGRNGQHRYNNQDHSMLTGFLAARNAVRPGAHDLWAVNVDSAYHEQVDASSGSGDRLVPTTRDAETLAELLSEAFARYDAVALGGAVGIVAGVGLFLATVVLLVQSDPAARPMLSLLANYFYGYEVSWTGAWIGLAEGAVGGGAVGWALGHLLNAVIGRERRRLEAHIERVRAVELMEGDV